MRSIRRLNWGFIVRGLVLALAAVLLASAVLFGLLFPAIPHGRVPAIPSTLGPTLPVPAPPLGLEVWAHYRGQKPQLAGSGFLFELPDGTQIAITAAHSFRLTNELEAIGFRQAGAAGELLFDRLHGPPGRPRLFGNNLTGDYLLLSASLNPLGDPLAMADPRGGPVEGERILVHSGVLRQPQSGGIFRSERTGAWAVMDARFEPALTSGAPVVSQHTGLVVGMALVAAWRENQLVLGMHPIGSIVEKGLASTQALPLADLP